MTNNIIVQELSQKAYQGIVEDVALNEVDQVCTHQACNKLHLSSLQLLDKREVPKPEDYQADPNPESIETTCPVKEYLSYQL